MQQKSAWVRCAPHASLMIALVLAAFVQAYAGGGRLDPSYGVEGQATIETGYDEFSVVTGIAVHADGKTVIAGWGGGSSGYGSLLFQRNADGTADTGFDGDGRLSLTPGSRIDALAAAEDGKSLVAFTGPSSEKLVARLNPDGSLDSSFGGDGIVEATAAALALQSDGKILAAGADRIARLHPDGSLDASFGGDGIVTIEVKDWTTGSEERIDAMAVQPDGAIVIASLARNETLDTRVTRFDSAGNIDATFGQGGSVDLDHGRNEMDNRLAVHADGRIVVGTSSWQFDGMEADGVIARLNPDGTLDATFAGGSVVMPNDLCSGVAAVGDRVLASGWEMVAAYGADGALDPTFAAGGLHVVADQHDISALAVQSDGRIIAGGRGHPTGIWFLRRMSAGCGDGLLDADEQCDDGNSGNGDGCDANCTLTPVVVVAAAGQTVTSDVAGAGATSGIPLVTTIQTPNAGTVSISSGEGDAPAGFSALGVPLQIEAPPATAGQPLVITLIVDATAIEDDVGLASLQVARNGSVVVDCTGSPGVASPDPCVASRTLLADGDAALTVLTSAASLWGVVLRGLDAAEQACVNAMNAAGVKVAEAQAKLASKCVKAASKSGADPQACVLATGALEKPLAKTTATAASRCPGAPPIGFTGAEAVNQSARSAALALLTDALGQSLSDAVIDSSDKAGAACQAAVLKALYALFRTESRSFVACKESLLDGQTSQISSASQLEPCLDAAVADPAGQARKARNKLAAVLEAKCASTNVTTALPGMCAAQPDPGACLAARAVCRLCGMFNGMDGMSRDCDAMDDRLLNASCEDP